MLEQLGFERSRRRYRLISRQSELQHGRGGVSQDVVPKDMILYRGQEVAFYYHIYSRDISRECKVV